MEEILINAGLTQPQAVAYIYLLEYGESRPPAIAKALGLTRSNAYKVLDSLQVLGLVSRQEFKKTFFYQATDPSALASLVAEKRNNIIALEQNIKQAIGELSRKYRHLSASQNISIQKGSEAMTKAYNDQARTGEPIYFIKSRHDIPFLGFDTMNTVRTLPSKSKMNRYGIVPDAPEAPKNTSIDISGNLNRTWVPTEDYTAPVEWSICGDTLLIQIFEGDGSVIKIQKPEVAESFQQIWKIIDKNIRANPSYTEFGPNARRAK